MKCKVCGRETDKLVDGMCMECFQVDAQKYNQLEETVIAMAEIKANEGVSHGTPVSEDILTNGTSGIKRMTKEQFKNSVTTRKMFILALMRMANIYDIKVQQAVVHDVEWMINNELDSFWGKNIRLRVGEENTRGRNILAHKNSTYIVEM